LTAAKQNLYICRAFAQSSSMPKPRNHIRHIGRTFYLSEWWDE